MRFRVTDERDWQHRFEAGDAAGLAAGIRAGCEAYQETGGSRDLRLHLWAPTDNPDGIWLTPTTNPTAPRVSTLAITWSDQTNRAIVTPTEHCEPVFDRARDMLSHHRNLMGLADHVGDAVRKAQYPGPQKMDDE